MIFVFAMKGLLLKFGCFLLRIFQSLHILHAQWLPQVDTFFSIGLYIQLVRELQPGMNLSINKHVIIEYNSFQMHKEDIRNLI